VDVFAPGPGAQIHDLNPSPSPPIGLFWTVAIPDHGVHVHLGEGRATLEAHDVPIHDYGNIVNALTGGAGQGTPGTVSFKVRWSGVNERLKIRNTDPIYGGFAGEFVRNAAQMEWTATVGDLKFVSDPLATSSSSFAEIGHERNGSFFSGEDE
jgi:hypothetical protein